MLGVFSFKTLRILVFVLVEKYISTVRKNAIEAKVEQFMKLLINCCFLVCNWSRGKKERITNTLVECKLVEYEKHLIKRNYLMIICESVQEYINFPVCMAQVIINVFNI